MAGKRTKQRPLWLSDEEDNGAVERAEAQGITVQQYLRFLLRRDLGMPTPGQTH